MGGTERMIKPRPVEHSSTLRGEGSKAGMDRRPPKLLTDAVCFLYYLGYSCVALLSIPLLIIVTIFSPSIIIRNPTPNKHLIRNTFMRFITYLLILALVLLIIGLVTNEVNTADLNQNFTGV